MRETIEVNPLHIDADVQRKEAANHSRKGVSTEGRVVVSLHQERISCQTW